jgi:hypothetical protein
MKKFIALATVAASLFAGTAEAREYDFSFVGYYSGLRIAEATGSLIWGDGRYKLDLNAKSDGIVDWFTVITHSTHSEGSFAKTPLAEKHYYLSTDGKKKTEIELAFKPGDVEIVAATPNPLKEKRSPVPKGMAATAKPRFSMAAAGMISCWRTARSCNTPDRKVGVIPMSVTSTSTGRLATARKTRSGKAWSARFGYSSWTPACPCCLSVWKSRRAMALAWCTW